MKKTAAWGVAALSVAAILCGSGPLAAKTIVIGPDDPNLQVAQTTPPGSTTTTPGSMNATPPGSTTATPPGTMTTTPPGSMDMVPSTDADNTKMNKGMNQSGGVTADQQGGNKSDREITRQIRKAVTDDKSLSTYARNVKIITNNGKVVLKGPVRTAEERTSIEQKAAAVAGAENVTNSIKIAPKK